MKEMIAERYVLEELPPEQRDAFEEHLFDCPECAAAVRDESVLMDSGRKLIHEPQPVPIRPPRAAWQTAAIAAVAITVMLTQLPFKRPAEQVPMASAAYFAVKAQPRGEGVPVFAVKRNEPISLGYDILTEPGITSYRAEVRDLSGRVLHSVPPVDGQTSPLSMQISAGTLPEGEYELVVSGERSRGGAAEVLTRAPFRVQYH